MNKMKRTSSVDGSSLDLVGNKDGNGPHSKKKKMSPSVSSTNLTNLSKSNSQEIKDLVQTLQEMFPNTCTEFLEEMSEELVGKPAALERFISEHLNNNSQPPDYWKPQIKMKQSTAYYYGSKNTR